MDPPFLSSSLDGFGNLIKQKFHRRKGRTLVPSTSLDGDQRGTEEVAAAVAVAIFPSPQPKTDDDCAFCDGDFDADRDRSDSCDDKKLLDVSFPNRW